MYIINATSTFEPISINFVDQTRAMEEYKKDTYEQALDMKEQMLEGIKLRMSFVSSTGYDFRVEEEGDVYKMYCNDELYGTLRITIEEV